jgi:putative transposase
MVRRSRPRWVRTVWAETRQTGEKNGTGRHLLVDEKGVPFGITLVGANRHDVSQLAAVLDNKVTHQPDTAKAVVENLCADAGYVGDKAEAIIRAHGYIPHVRPRGEEIKATKNKRFKPRRRIVEVSHSWLNNFRKLKVRYEKKTANAIALHHLAAASIALRRCRGKTCKNVIYG